MGAIHQISDMTQALAQGSKPSYTMMNHPGQLGAQLLAWTLTPADTCKTGSNFSVGSNNQRPSQRKSRFSIS